MRFNSRVTAKLLGDRINAERLILARVPALSKIPLEERAIQEKLLFEELILLTNNPVQAGIYMRQIYAPLPKEYLSQ